jgi:predicted DsbA family dithiol-disulfide isomerase
MQPRFVLYSDFACPFCYALNERLLALGLAERAEWRGVEHAPDLPVPMCTTSEHLARELEQEVRSIRRVSPEVPVEQPAGKPNTGLAIRWTAAAFEVDPVRAHAFKDALYRELWQRGGDLSDEALLRQVAHAHDFADHLRPDAQRPRVERWRQEWGASGTRGVPAIVRADGESLLGLVGHAQLVEFLDGSQHQTGSRP